MSAPRARPLHTSPGMGGALLDLDAQLENIRGLKDDLEEIFRTTPADAVARYGIGLAIGQIAQRIAALEDAVRHHDCDEIAIPEMTVDERRALDRALEILDGEITAEDLEQRFWPRLRSVFVAIDEMLFAAARGIPASEAHIDPRPRHAVVLPLVRSNR
jgi:hypothetical protein